MLFGFSRASFLRDDGVPPSPPVFWVRPFGPVLNALMVGSGSPLATAFSGTVLAGCGGNTALLLSRACSVSRA